MVNHLDVAPVTTRHAAVDAQQYCSTCGKRRKTLCLAEDGPAGCPECGILSRLLRAVGLGMLPFLDPDAVLPDLKATHRDAAVREIVESLAGSGDLAEAEIDSIVASLLRREELGSTGIGECVAIPHAKHPAVTREIGTIAWSARGLDFNSVDGRPVHLIVLLLSPVDHPSDHIRALAKVSKFIRPRA